MKLIAIDPGKRSGIAFFENGKLKELKEVSADDALEIVKSANCTAFAIEDSRMHRNVYSAKCHNPLVSAKIGRDIGRLDKLCEEIVKACNDAGNPIMCISPKRKGKKMGAKEFNKAYGWKGRTNQHERDAALVGFRAMF